MQYRVGFGVADSEIAFVGLAFDEVGGGGFVDDDFGDAEFAGDLPDLGFEKVSEGVNRRGVVGVPGVVAEQAFAFVSGSDRDAAEFGGLVEQDDHSAAGAYVSEPLRRDFAGGVEVAVHHSGDFDGFAVDAEVVDDELGVVKALLAGNFVRHSEGVDVFGSEGASAEVGDDSGIDAARESKHDFFHISALFDFAFEEVDEPF